MDLIIIIIMCSLKTWLERSGEWPYAAGQTCVCGKGIHGHEKKFSRDSLHLENNFFLNTPEGETDTET